MCSTYPVYVQSTSDKYWTNTGQVLDKYWTSTGQRLAQIADKCGANGWEVRCKWLGSAVQMADCDGAVTFEGWLNNLK